MLMPVSPFADAIRAPTRIFPFVPAPILVNLARNATDELGRRSVQSVSGEYG